MGALCGRPAVDEAGERSCTGSSSTFGRKRSGATASALHHAVSIGDVQALQDVVAEEVLCMRMEDGLTPLCHAAQRNHHGMVAFLLQQGADPLAGRDGNTALHLACMHGSEPMARAILDVLPPSVNKRAYLAARNVQDMTPLHLAVLANSVGTVNVLLKHDSSPLPSTCSEGKVGKLGIADLLEAAQIHGNSDMVLRLLQHAASRMEEVMGGDASRSSTPPHPTTTPLPTSKTHNSAMTKAVLADHAQLSGNAAAETMQAMRYVGHGDTGHVPSLAKLAGRAHKKVLQRRLAALMMDSTTCDAGEEGERTLSGAADLAICETDHTSGASALMGDGDGCRDEAWSHVPDVVMASACALCPVCKDRPALIKLHPYCHRMCTVCSVQMVTWQVSTCPVACPTCHGSVGDLGYL
ncbi:hypothetical protein FOA52_007495 [Chlamydomonas sp. UWO 241]|nr:hypothetical protein FOA52_007495 [Chlamydomonas sp. UWO 241]